MNEQEIKELLETQRKFYLSGATLSVELRIEKLKKLYLTIKAYEQEINDALLRDLGKSRFESFTCETGMVLSEITYMLKHIKKFSRRRRVKTPLAQFYSKSYRIPMPYGNVLIMSPWNYPLLLTLDPLVDAVAAGNTAIVKPSAYSPETSAVIKKIIGECFDSEYVAVVTGGRYENTALLSQKFNLIFFTGSQSVGKEVLRRTAEHLTPAILELGGKSPCIVDASANIQLAAKRIVFGKYLNCGQTCVAPDYVLCEASAKAALVKAVTDEIKKQYGDDPLNNNEYGRIVNKKHFDRLCGLIDQTKVVVGGKSNAEALKIEPTVMDNVTYGDAVMGEEIFGPIMPIIEFDSFDQVIEELKEKEKPLALYLFTSDKSRIKRVTTELSYGGGCINDVIIHLATNEMGFGGVGESGMGSYHGKEGFDAFSHYKSIVDKSTLIDLPMRYKRSDGKNYEKTVRFFLK